MAVQDLGERRSGCPVSISLEMIGDRWTLLIVRDLMVRGIRTFRGFQNSGEGIATNILSDRLRRLEQRGIVRTSADPADGRRLLYRLTEKGIDLAPVLLELLLWAAAHELTSAPKRAMAAIRKDRKAFLDEIRKRWREDDPTPVLLDWRMQ